jgi:HEAT repeat protein
MTAVGIRYGLLLALVPGIPPGALDAPDEPRPSTPVLREGPPLPLVLQWLRSDDSSARAEAAMELRLLGDEARVAIPDLVEASRRSDSRAHLEALATLCRLGAPEATALVREVLETGGRRRDAYAELRQLGGAAVPQYLELLFEPRHQAAVLMLLDGRSAEAVPPLLRGLGHTDARVRAIAARGLARLGPEDTRPALPRLLRALDDEDATVRAYAAWAVWLLEHNAERVVPHLAAALSHPDAEVRAAMGSYLYSMGDKAAAAAPALVEALGDDNDGVANQARSALEALGEAALPDLILGLREGSVRRRRQAVDALRRLRPPPDAVVPPLMAALEADDAQLRVEAAQTLALLAPRRRPTAVAVLTAALDDRQTCRAAAQVLESLGPDARAAVPALSARLADRDPEFAVAVAGALLVIEPRSSHWVLPAVVEALGSTRRRVRREALACLERIGPEGCDAIPSLLVLLRMGIDSSERGDPDNVMRALVRVGGGGSAVPMLLEALSGRAWTSDRYTVASCLGMLGQEAVPALIAVTMDSDRRTTRAARMALRRISRNGGP